MEIDPVKLFNYERFLNLYFNSGVDADRESWSFLRYFTSMPLFKHLVERIVLEKDDLDLKVFEQRLIENQYNHHASGPSSAKQVRDREQVMVKERSERLIDCYPFHEVAMTPKPDLEAVSSYQRLNIPPPMVAGYAKLKHICEFYKYRATPQFLDQELMMQLFNR